MDWRILISGIGILALIAVMVAEASADVVCRKKRGVLVLRSDTVGCRKRETLVDLSQFGLAGEKGDKGDRGDTGDPGPFPSGNLPSGITLRGVYRVASERSAGSGLAQDGITFVFPLASEPTPHLIEEGDTPPAECPGTAASPEALPGHLCLYETFASADISSGSKSIGNPVTNFSPGASRFGFQVSAQSSSDGNFAMVGTWAATAPE